MVQFGRDGVIVINQSTLPRKINWVESANPLRTTGPNDDVIVEEDNELTGAVT